MNAPVKTGSTTSSLYLDPVRGEPAWTALEETLAESAGIPAPSFLSRRWIDDNVFFNSQQIARLAAALGGAPDQTSRLYAGVPEFLARPDRDGFSDLLLANWRNPLFCVLALTTSLQPTRWEAVREFFKPLWRRARIPTSLYLYDGDWDFCDHAREFAESIAAPGRDLRAAAESLTAGARSDLAAEMLFALALLRPDAGETSAEIALALGRDGACLRTMTAARLKTARAVAIYVAAVTGAAKTAAMPAPQMVPALPAAPAQESRRLVRLRTKLTAAWFFANFTWRATDGPAIRSFDPRAADAATYDTRAASDFLADSFADFALFDRIVARIMADRKEAGIGSAYLCQRLVERAVAASRGCSCPPWLKRLTADFEDDDFRAFGLLLASRSEKNHRLAEDALLAMAIEGFASPEMFQLALRFPEEAEAAHSYLELRHPDEMNAELYPNHDEPEASEATERFLEALSFEEPAPPPEAGELSGGGEEDLEEEASVGAAIAYAPPDAVLEPETEPSSPAYDAEAGTTTDPTSDAATPAPTTTEDPSPAAPTGVATSECLMTKPLTTASARATLVQEAAEWYATIDAIQGEAIAARIRPPSLDFVAKFEAYLPLLRKQYAEFVERQTPVFGPVRERLLPLLKDLLAYVPSEDENEEIRRDLAGIIAATEAIAAEATWSREAADAAEGIMEEIVALHARAVTAHSELTAVMKEIMAGKQGLALLTKATAASGGILESAREAFKRSTSLLSTVIEPAVAAGVSDVPGPSVVAPEPGTVLSAGIRPDREPETTPTAAELVAAISPEPEDEAPAAPVAVADFSHEETVPTATPAEDYSLADRELMRLIADRSFGMAYHVAAAMEACGAAPSVSSAELRLAASAPYLNLPAMQNSGALLETEEALAAVLARVQGDLPEGELGLVRRLLMFSGAIGPALLGRNATAIEIVRATAMGARWDKAAYPLKEQLSQASRSSAPLITIERCRMLKRNSDAHNEAHTAKGRLINAVERLRERTFQRFQIGTTLAKTLVQPEQEIGEIALAVQTGRKDAVALARDFAAKHSTSAAANDLMQDVNRSIAAHHGTDIKGAVRTTLVNHILEIAACCVGYVGAMEAATDNDEGSRRNQKEVRDAMLRGVRETEEATRALLAPNQHPALVTAVGYAVDMLGRQRRLLDGDYAVPGHADHLFAVHGSLAAVPGLVFGKSWKPTPYEGSSLLQTLLSGEHPPLRDLKPGAVTEDEYHAILRDRLAEGSFAAANLMVEMTEFLGINPQVGQDAAAAVERAVPVAQETAARMVADARRALSGLLRFGSPQERIEADVMTRRLDMLKLADLPRIANADARTEDETGEMETVDISAVVKQTRNIRERIRVIAAGHRRLLTERLDAGIAAGRIDPETAAPVRRAIEHDDIIVAREWVGKLEAGLELPTTEHANVRLATLLPHVTDFAQRTGVIRHAAAHARNGTDYGPLAYSKLGPGRRTAAAAYLDAWSKMRDALQDVSETGLNTSGRAVSAVLDMLRKLGIAAKAAESIVARDSSGGRSVTFEMRGMKIPHDPNEADALVLPDFGSQTKGLWKIMVCESLPASHEIASFVLPSNDAGRLILVTGPVATEERRRLGRECRDAGRRVLVVDDAIALAVSAEAELRPATMVELAQPFSFSQPFKDYGKEPVPPETFVGRAVEMRDVLDPMGTNILYGGRRLGKTAMLLHIANSHHNPAEGMIAVHVDIQFIGMDKPIGIDEIWRILSDAMKDVFPEPVDDADAFEKRIREWLGGTGRSGHRILLMIDEADRFIENDARDEYRRFNVFVRLMSQTSRRFKVVFAGLHNVTKLARGSNSPIMQVGSNPVCIGPIEAELEMAERLLTKPLSALGYEFERRELVWTILSKASYMPATLQLVGQRFLEVLRSLPLDLRTAPPVIITTEMVNDALDHPKIKQAIAHVFNTTIDVDARYKLIVNIIGQDDLLMAELGEIYGGGLTSVQVLDKATHYWPKQFDGIDAQQQIDGLLDEMEGLGLLRRESEGDVERWTLRSPQISMMLGDSDKVEKTLDSFKKADPPARSEIKAMRRMIRDERGERHPSPLTYSQESDVVNGRSVTLLVGNIASGLADVSVAVREAFRAATARCDAAMHVASETDNIGSLAKLLSGHAKRGGEHVFLFDEKSRWNLDHLHDAIAASARMPQMKGVNPAVRTVFVASPERWQELTLGDDGRFEGIGKESMLPVVIGLGIWNNDVIDAVSLQSEVSVIGPDRAVFKEVTGGFGALAYAAIRAIRGAEDKSAALERWFAEVSAKPGFLASLGIRNGNVPLFRELLQYGEDGIGNVDDVKDALYPDDRDLTRAHRFLAYTSKLGLITASRAKTRGGVLPVRFNGLLRRLGPLLEKEK